MFVAIPIVIDNMAFSSIVVYCDGTIDRETFTLKIIHIKDFRGVNFSQFIRLTKYF